MLIVVAYLSFPMILITIDDLNIFIYRVIVFNATFKNISVISWRSVL